MSSQAARADLDPGAASEAAPPAGRDWAQPLIDRQLALLGDLAEMAAVVCGTLTRQIADPDHAAERPALALAFDRAGRALRLTLSLQARLIADRQAWENSVVQDERMFRTARASEREDRAEARKDRVERIIRRVADGAEPEAEDDAGEDEREDRIERLLDAARERLDEDDVYDVLAHPVSDTIAYICRLLGLSPDWPRLAEEAWAREEIATGPVGAPLAALASPARGERAAKARSSQGRPRPVRRSLGEDESGGGGARPPDALSPDALFVVPSSADGALTPRREPRPMAPADRSCEIVPPDG